MSPARAPTAVSEALRGRVRSGVDLAACVGASIASVVGGVNLARGAATEHPATFAVMIVLAILGFLGLRGSAPWTPIAYVGVILFANVMYMLTYGTWVGLGAVYVLAVALAFSFMSARAAWAVACILVGTPAVLAVLYATGVLTDPPEMLLGDGATWRRTTIAGLTAIVGTALMSSYAVRQLTQERRDVELAHERQREKHLEQTRVEAELARVRRVESIAELAAEVGADIGAALAVVEARARALTAELHGRNATECLGDIVEATSNAGSIMRSLTVFAPDARVEPRGDVAEAVRSLPKLVRRMLPARIALEVAASEPAPVAIDTVDLARVLANLVLNARDAIAEAGTIAVRVARDGDAVRIEVQDTGSGMSDEVLQHVFQPFFTTKAVGRGTGLGLATAKVLVDRARGSIAVTSAVGRGTTFTIRLPLLA